MPKQPHRCVGPHTHPIYRGGVTHDVVYRSGDEAIQKVLIDRLKTEQHHIYTNFVEYRRRDGLKITDALLKAYLGEDAYDSYRKDETAAKPQLFAEGFLSMFATRGDDTTSIISVGPNGRFFYKGKGYEVAVFDESKTNRTLRKINEKLQPYVTISPKNDELAQKMVRDYNLEFTPKVKVPNLSQCLGHCSEIAFVDWNVEDNIRTAVLVRLRDKYKANHTNQDKIQQIKEIQDPGSGNTVGLDFEYGNARFEMRKNDDLSMRITPQDTATADEFVEKLLENWNEDAPDEGSKLTKLIRSRCNLPIYNCIDVGFNRPTFTSWGHEGGHEVGKYANITMVMDEMKKTYGGGGGVFAGTHDDLFDKFQRTIEPVPPSVEHHPTYDGGIGPLGNVLAEM